MLFLISPAKALDYETPAHVATHTQPLFVKQATELVGVMREKSPQQIAELMDLSDALAGLNAARYEAWRPRFTTRNAKQAALAFDGDVYGGLDAKTLSATELDWLQQHLCILSGLYGVLRPLDLMQPYRLEMGTRLKTARGRNLYEFWGRQVAEYLNERAMADKTPVIVNLASEEYFKVVDRKALVPRVVTCVFEERKAEGYKVISFMAKRARGLMARYAVKHRLTLVEQLRRFDLEGYRFHEAASASDRLVFRREAPPARTA
ncbi:peroxide stress protein YaaA [Hydrogenophaga sp.]|uniref:peroxide stress protein YaaA n=1 Tax=Hydrogenophaga sp. TaxID=1904254 RepID=UPI00261D8ABD|nr:peroxide stress protein YaaA [Hydrogenophaga sp.]MCW5654316.1 peroxide stress protein YaaA [Hydrogenophaga sp.]